MSLEEEKYIGEFLLQEMVFDRCFCDPNSREFVEFAASDVDPSPQSNEKSQSRIYSATATVNFSGTSKEFPIVVKLLHPGASASKAFGYFQNEEIFYNKMLKKYDPIDFPKCYVANLGKYERPVIVLENLLARGFQKKRELGDEEMRFSIGRIARFHGRGLKLKKDSPANFQEYRAQFSHEGYENVAEDDFNDFVAKSLESLPCEKLAQKLKNSIKPNPLEQLKSSKKASESSTNTIIHGNFLPQNVLIKSENGKVVDAKISNFEFMEFNSIGVDLARILLENRSYEILSSSEKFKEILSFYAENLHREFSDVTIDDVRSAVFSALPYAYLTLLWHAFP